MLLYVTSLAYGERVEDDDLVSLDAGRRWTCMHHKSKDFSMYRWTSEFVDSAGVS